jgi:hypothetical protein
MNKDLQLVHEAFVIIEKLAAVASTPGVSEENVKEANSLISSLISGVVKPYAVLLKAEKNGLIV